MQRLQRHRKAKILIAEIMDRPDTTVIVHYSCESFYDRQKSTSPRITSIAVRHLDSAQTTSFSIHQMAERNHIPIAELSDRSDHYDELERQMLGEFFACVKTHDRHRWLHWNMRDSNYGFPALAHRFRVLGGEPVDIREDHLADLAALLIDIYGTAYASHPRLKSLVDLNKMSRKDFLNGAEEACAFDDGDYVKLHLSTLRKVDILAHIAEHANDGTLVTQARWRDIYGGYPGAFAAQIQERPIAVIAAFIATVVGFAIAVLALFHH